MGRALGGDMYVPHAIDVDGQIITVFDPVNHVPPSRRTTGADAHQVGAARSPLGPREAPRRTVGGELTLEMLDLSFNSIRSSTKRRSS